MYQVVHAKCPHCKNLLRIPADWLAQPMRCKHCHLIFQAKAKPAGVPAQPPGVSAHTPTPATRGKPSVTPKPPTKNGAPFDFSRTGEGPVASPRRHGKP